MSPNAPHLIFNGNATTGDQIAADRLALSAPMAEQVTGASRAAAQRNLDSLAARGLVREITGQGRFRMWAAKV